MAEKIKVFVSSILDPKKEDLVNERNGVLNAVNSIPIAEPWAFEKAPASAKELEASYLDEVASCDIYVIILAGNLTNPVHNEYLLARSLGKPVLIFAKKGVQRAQAVQDLLDEADLPPEN